MTSILRFDILDPLFKGTPIEKKVGGNSNDEMLKIAARASIKALAMFAVMLVLVSPALILGGAVGVGIGLSAALIMAATTAILEAMRSDASAFTGNSWNPWRWNFSQLRG